MAVLLCLAMGGVAANIPSEDPPFLSAQFMPHILLLIGQPPPEDCWVLNGDVVETCKLRKWLH